MQHAAFESLAAFATEDRILRLIAKERGKYTAKNGGSSNPFHSDPLYQALRSMTPPHRLWSDPGRGKLPKKASGGIAKWTARKKRAEVRVYQAIRKHRDRMPDAPWVLALNEFVASVREAVSGLSPLVLETPRIIPKFKEQDPDSGDFIYRPLCKYSDLRTKVILALAYRYILDRFDRYFHQNMLFMRSARPNGNGAYTVPKYLDAIDLVSDYQRCNDHSDIFVGECDIQKFYDIFNHDVIVECFEQLFEEAKRRDGAQDADFDGLRRVLCAYLDSFNYPGHVMSRNGDDDFWRAEKCRHRSSTHPQPICRFKWVAEEAFVSSGCYTEEAFRKVRDEGKLGIPQGGALSGIIVNVVMHAVDKPVVTPDDDRRLFIRYCDDILLLHTDRNACVGYLDCYIRQLVAHKLVPHPMKDVSGFKSGEKTGAGFWHSKSKNVYRWGSGGGDASDWLAFVGYEMRRTGEIRIRKDKIDNEFRRIAHRYYDIIFSKEVTGGEPLSEERKRELMKRMDSLSDHFLDYEKAGNNVYTRSQARRLDKYLYRKARQAARRIGIADDKRAARERVTYKSKIKNL